MTSPSPDTTHLVLRQMPHGGWIIADHTGELAAFSQLWELCSWLECRYPEDSTESPPMPRVVRPDEAHGDTATVTSLQRLLGR